MESGYVTTPFGRRTMTLGMLISQAAHSKLDADRSVDKWRLFRSICLARSVLGISDRALAVLNALLSFYPKNELSETNGLVVFPSNAQLSLRCHGMAEATLRRHLASLVAADLLIRKDSPNGKRYARKDEDGAIDEAFGFSIAPLVSRAMEIETIAAEVEAEQQHLRRLRERLTLCRRDIAKLVEAALEEGSPGDWGVIYSEFRTITARIPRKADAAATAALLDELDDLRSRIITLLETQVKSDKTSGNALNSERHIQNSNTHYLTESELAHEKSKGGERSSRDDIVLQQTNVVAALNPVSAKAGFDRRGASEGGGAGKSSSPTTHLPLSLVLQACPEIVMFGKEGRIESWRGLMSAAVVVRSMLGVSPSAYEEASATMGPENAATAIACILERGGLINSAGGYLRDLTRRCEKGEFSVGPMVMALLRANAPAKARAG